MTCLKPTKYYDWKDSNIALFGSDVDKEVKKEAAEQEEAWKMVKDIQSSTVVVWRIRNFKLTLVSLEDIGKFFSGDSYIVLKVNKVGNSLTYNVHFWIGKESTQDEYGTAAYKTVELDTFLDDIAIQHREVDGFESDLFKSYFNVFETLKGGFESGFKHVEPNAYKPRLLVFRALERNNVELSEVAFTKRSLHSGDVFILDLGHLAFQWNGKDCNTIEKVKAAQFLQQLEGDRNGRCQTEVIDEGNHDCEKIINEYLPDKEITEKVEHNIGRKMIYKLSDESGKMKRTLVCEDHLPRKALNCDDVFLIDTGYTLFVYIGDKCTRREKQDALSHAHNYLLSTNHPFVPITVVSGNRVSNELNKVLE